MSVGAISPCVESESSSPEPSSLYILSFLHPGKKSKKKSFVDSKMCPKSQKMKLQKHFLEVSNSSRNKVRAFFRFTAERKNYEFFQMSQKKRLEILRCVVLLKVFTKKRSLFGSKNSATLLSETILNPSQPGTLCSARTVVVL
jgi:hypothetical protein